MTQRESLDEMFEHAVDLQTAQADAQDNDPVYQARIAAQREAQINREIARGLRDANGEWIEQTTATCFFCGCEGPPEGFEDGDGGSKVCTDCYAEL